MKRPIVAGGALALGAAITFGVTTPLVQRFGRGLGAFTTAALLYAGSALFAVVTRRGGESPLRRSDAPRLLVVALMGAVFAPIALAWGLQRTSGVSASLLLNLEALFTVVLARALWDEPISGRVAGALVATLLGGVVLVLDGRSASAQAGWGAFAVVAATLAWAADGVVGRPLSERDPSQVVLAKGLLGATLSLGLARAAGEAWAATTSALALVACGAVGYGASLRLYLMAQRAIGAARTGTIFAAAPFLGAAVAWAMGERAGGPATVAAAALCALGVGLQLTESHAHAHIHEPLEHEHVHGHDDGHHDHVHDPPVTGAHAHAHAHSHGRVTHAHAHGEDVHHRHQHRD